MATINQLVRKPRVKKVVKSNVTALNVLKLNGSPLSKAKR